MKSARFLATLVLLMGLSGIAHSQSGCVRLSWGTCDPWVANKSFGSPPYVLVYSIYGVGDVNAGCDSQIRIRHLSSGGSSAVGDAWRFDDAGCQAGEASLSDLALNRGCPAFRGPAPLAITQFANEADGSETLRLAVAYDDFTPSAGTRYTAWIVTFNHSNSSAGPSPSDHSTCGDADLCENFSFDFAKILVLTGQTIALTDCDSDMSQGAPAGTLATWNGGCASGGTAEKSTWGKVKGSYR
jgi:hypothetical protein